MVPNVVPKNFIWATVGLHLDGIWPYSAGIGIGEAFGVFYADSGLVVLLGEEQPESSHQIVPNNTNRTETAPNGSQHPSQSPSEYRAEHRRISRIGQNTAPAHPYIPPGKSCLSILLEISSKKAQRLLKVPP